MKGSVPCPRQNAALIRAIYAAFAAGDIAGVRSRMAPDIVWNEAENFPYADASFQQYTDTLQAARVTGAV